MSTQIERCREIPFPLRASENVSPSDRPEACPTGAAP